MGDRQRGMAATLGLLGLLIACLLAAASPVGPRAAIAAQLPTLLAIESPPGRDGNTVGGDQLRALDPRTLGDLPGFPPIDLGASQVTAIAPGGRTLAALVYPQPPMPPPAGPSSATLHLIDLAAWRDTPTDLHISGTVAWMGFALDGRALYWLVHDGVPGFGPRPTSYRLMRYDLHQRREHLALTLPGPLLGDPAITVRVGARDVGWLALYYVPADATSGPTDAPHLLRFDLRGDRVRYDVALGGVRQGTFADEAGAERFAIPGLAWDLDRERLHIVHADADRLTTVDLGDGAILGQRIIAGVTSPRTGDVSPWTAIRRATMPGAVRVALLGTGGARLFVRGQTVEVVRQADGSWQERYIFTGVRVVDVASAAEIARLGDEGQITITPDGSRLLVHTMRYEGGQPVDDARAFRLAVYDATSLREMGSLAVTTGEIWPTYFSPDGRYAYLLRPQGGTLTRMGRVAPLAPSKIVARFDLETQRVTAERPGDDLAWLIPLWPDAR